MNKLLLVNGPPPAAAHANNSRPWFKVMNQSDASKPAEILIYDFIGKDVWSDTGISAKEFADELKVIPTDSKINIRINSQGGNVWDGLAIYNMLQPRRDKITCYIDGIAASAASWIALAGAKTVIPKNAFMMIHETKAMFYGTADDIENQLPAIRKHDELIVNIYEQKTGKSRADIEGKMKAETWFTGDEAKAFGLADEVTDEIVLTACAQFDLSLFRRVPDSLAQAQKGTPNNNPQQRNDMDKTKVIAMLKARGISVSDDASEEVLLGHLAKLGIKPADVAAPPPAPPAAPTPAIDQTMLTNMANQFTAMSAAMAAMKKTEITNRVKRAADECRIPVDQIDAWIARGEKDETVLNDLEKLPQHLPGHAPIGISITSPDLKNVSDNYHRKMNPDDGKACGILALQNAALYMENRAKIIGAWNTNTVDASLKQDVILQETMLALRPAMIPITAFARNLGSVPLRGTNIVQVPYYALDSTTAETWNAAVGYVTGNTTSDTKPVTVATRKHLGIDWSSDEFNTQPWLDIETKLQMKMWALAKGVLLDIMSEITLANYGNDIWHGTSGEFDSSDAIDIEGTCADANWPSAPDGSATSPRSMILATAYYGSLVKDPYNFDLSKGGSTDALRNAAVKRIAGFNTMRFPSMPTTNSLVGFVVFQGSGLLVATAPVAPDAEVMSVLRSYQVVTDPETGLSFSFRAWGDATLDRSYKVAEIKYGKAVGEAAALKRICSAASEA